MKVAADILGLFGQASGLTTNQSKCAVYPIRCDGLDMNEVMEGFQCPVQGFPCKYLGLPLHLRQLRRVDVQPLIDKTANRLATWKGRFLNKAGRLKLLNSVLSSMPTYFLTVFAPKKWLLKRIDKIRRSFLWKGTEDANGGHSLVKWENVKKPKKVGGLGVLDLDFFSRALRLRWLWFQWFEPDRPWVGMEVPCNETDKQLFRASTIVKVGNGQRARFWESPWLEGQAPRDIAPNLFKLAWRKNLTVEEELQNLNWTRGLWNMSSATEIAELVILWGELDRVQLTNEEDVLLWKWTRDGHYTVKSAYDIQFAGTYPVCNTRPIWEARVEGKHRFFAWLLVQERILTADKLLVRNWPCNPICPLCDQHQESALHLCLNCVYSREVWFLVQNWTEGLVSVPNSETSVEEWWNRALAGQAKEQRRRKASIMIYTTWNIWKERNRRVFQQTTAMPTRILSLIKEEIKLRESACGSTAVLLN